MIDLSNKTIALIGGAGFIGHNLGLALKGLGAQVHVVDGLQVNNLLAFAGAGQEVANRDLYLRILNERLDLLRNAEIPLHVIDARDYHALSRVLATIAPDIVVHLAAVAHANVSNKDPFSTFDHSLRTLENALDNCRHRTIERFIYLSSSMIYGDFDGGMVTEESICSPLGIYGALKFSGEKMVIGYNQVFKLPYTIIRPSALYGQRCVSRRVGQIFIENAMTGREITINGDGNEYLDFTYIGDFVQGVVRCMQHEEARNEIFNITYGNARTISDMVDILQRYYPDATIRHTPRDQLLPKRGTLSIDKARRLVGFEPAYPLERGFAEYIDWYRSFGAGGIPVIDD